MKTTPYNISPEQQRALTEEPQVGVPLPMMALAFGLLSGYLPMVLPGQWGSGLRFLGWLVPLLASALFVVFNIQRIRFPVVIWLPWILWAVFYLTFAEAANALQRTVMLLTPLAVGAAFSALPANPALLERCYRWLWIFFWVFIGAAAAQTGLLFTGKLYNVTGFAAGSITASLLAAWFAVLYAIGRQPRHLLCWLLLATVPVLANTRTGMVAVALTLPLVLCPFPFYKRALIIGVLAVAGIGLFYTERIQQKMFYSGEGTLQEAIDNTYAAFTGEGKMDFNFATSGRYWLNKILSARLDEAYWLGHGANTTEAVSVSITNVTHPHNDWLRLRYEYGLIGTLLFGGAMLATALHALRRAEKLRSSQGFFLYAGATAFVPMTIFMFTDNVIMYAAWFGNLHFALLGIGYAAVISPGRPSAPAALDHA